jgi:hypothetical protein
MVDEVREGVAPALGCPAVVLGALTLTLALALGVDVALAALPGLTVAPADRVGVGVVGVVGVGVVGVGPDVVAAVGSPVGVADGVGAAVADGIGEGVGRPRWGDGLGGRVARAGPTGVTTCWAGPGDGVVSRPIPATAPTTAAARQTLPPAAIARRRQRSRRPRLMISATSADPVCPGAWYPGSWSARRARRSVWVSRSVMTAPLRARRRGHLAGAGRCRLSCRTPPTPGASRARASWWISRSRR